MKTPTPSTASLVLATQLYRELEARLQRNDDRFARPRRQLRDLLASCWQPVDQALSRSSSSLGGR